MHVTVLASDVYEERKTRRHPRRFLVIVIIVSVMLTHAYSLLGHRHECVKRIFSKNIGRLLIIVCTFLSASVSCSMSSSVEIVPRRSDERGHADHGWLRTYHTWSFASYHDSRYPNGFGCLRVLNEDRVQPSTGFGTHSHREYEIFSYVVDGELQHQDSMGNTEIIHRGEVQFTSTGTGIEHSEYNVNKSRWVHFIQIWVQPTETHLKPSYTTKKWSDEQKLNQLCLIIDDIHKGSDAAIGIHGPLAMFASILEPNQSVKHVFKRSKGYVHLIMRTTDGTCAVNTVQLRLGTETILREGDGAFIHCSQSNGELTIDNVGSSNAEFLLFDLD